MTLQRVLDDGEAEARTAELARAARVDAIKALGQARQMFGRNADAGIRHRNVTAVLVDPIADVDAPACAACT